MNKVKFSRHYLVFLNNKTVQAVFMLAIILAVFYRDVVFHGRTFLVETAASGTMVSGPYNYKGRKPGFVANDPGAIAWQTEPFNRFISKSVKNRDFPLWNPYAGLAGSPLLADGHTGPLEPIQFFFFFIPTRFWTQAIDIQLLTRFLIAGFGCYLFSKRLGLSFIGSVTVGVLFMLSSYFVTFGNHPQIKTEMLLPLVAYGYDRLADEGDKKSFGLSSLFIGWAIIAAMPEATFFVLFIGTLWYFYKTILTQYGKKLPVPKIRNIILRYIASTLFGFLISAVYLIPFLEFLSISKHVHSPGAGIFSMPLWLLPNLIFQVKSAPYMQIGFFAFFSMSYLLISLRGFDKHRGNIIFFSAYTIVALLAIFDFSPTNWIKHSPIINQIALYKYAIPSIVFCLAVITGIFVDSIKESPPQPRKLMVSVTIVIMLFIILPVLGNPVKSLSLYFESTRAMVSNMGYVLGIPLTIFLLSYLFYHRDISVRIFQASLFVLSISGSFFSSQNISRPDRVDPYQSPPFLNHLMEEKEPFRVFALNGILYPNVSTAYRISDIRWLNALIPRRTYDFTTAFITPEEPKTSRFTGTILPISDAMFSLLNVKYVLSTSSKTIDSGACVLNSSDGPYFGVDTIHGLILDQNQDGERKLREVPLVINGVTRMGILAHPPQEFSVSIRVTKESSILRFSIGLNPEVFFPDRGDGVDFRITLIEGGNRFNLFSAYIDPKTNPCDRKWFDESINLHRWLGKEVALIFSTGSGLERDTSWDWAYWGDIQLNGTINNNAIMKNSNSPDYYLAYQDNNIRIYENSDVLPRAFIVYNVINVSDFESAMDRLSAGNINFGQIAIVENLPKELEQKINGNSAEMPLVPGVTKQMSSGKFQVGVNTKAPGLLVVTEQYYPGWEALVDGERVPIYAVNGILRGIFLEGGYHVIQFQYRPLTFKIGGLITTLSFLFVSFSYFFGFRLPRKHYDSK